MLVIADSSPLHYLTLIGQAELLPAIFGEILIPTAVIGELSAEAAPKVVRDFIEQRPAWLHTRAPNERGVAAISSSIHRGEREALALALEVHADLVLMDDSAGRKEAKLLGIRITGTLGVLRLGAERGLIDVPLVVRQLQETGFFVREELIRSAFREWL